MAMCVSWTVDSCQDSLPEIRPFVSRIEEVPQGRGQCRRFPQPFRPLAEGGRPLRGEDVEERAHWDEYMAAYQECFRETSTEWAPWHIIPADDKAFMRVAVAGIICRTLEKLKLRYPEVPPEKRQALLEAKARLESERA